MKQSFLFGLLMLWVCSLSAQTAIPRSQVEDYLQALEVKDWDRVLDHYYPGLYDHIPRAQFKSVLQMMDNPTLSTVFSNMELANISNPYLSGSGKYIDIEYNVRIELTLKGELWTNELIDEMVHTMQEEYGEAYHDPMARMVISEGSIHLLAINDPRTNGEWKLVENSLSMREILNKLIPPDVFVYFNP